MNKRHTILLIIIFSFCASIANAQKDTDLGASLSFEADKELSRFFRLSFEEEIRLVNSNRYGFDRSATALGLDYSFLEKKAKVGVAYSFLYLYNSDYLFESRHRFYVNLSYKEDVGSFTLSWRGRFQGTVRDENRGSYNVNPKYVLRNRFQAEYNFWKSRWTPFVSCEITNPVNDSRYDLSRLRFQGGTEYRLYRNTYLSGYVRYDVNYEKADNNRLSVGFTYRIKL
ncbi:hypothetical protein M2138_001301 [Dysgonomonadaceae bacterium PH5-43]|nr:hypothetical protein [Dysgonomonadaceae bacterium PH5-43]